MSGTDWDKSPQEWFDAKARHAATAAELFRQFLEWESISNDIIDFKKIYVDMANDLNAGLVLSEIVYWYLPSRGKTTNKLRVKKEGKLWIACRRYEWWDRTRMSPKMIDRALVILKECGLIEQKNFAFNGERTVHIRLIEEKFLELWQYLADNPPVNPYLPKGNSTRGNEPKLPDGEDLNPNYPKVNSAVPQRGRPITESTTENNNTLSAGADGARKRKPRKVTPPREIKSFAEQHPELSEADLEARRAAAIQRDIDEGNARLKRNADEAELYQVLFEEWEIKGGPLSLAGKMVRFFLCKPSDRDVKNGSVWIDNALERPVTAQELRDFVRHWRAANPTLTNLPQKAEVLGPRLNAYIANGHANGTRHLTQLELDLQRAEETWTPN